MRAASALAPYPRHVSVLAAQSRAADREASEAYGIPSLVLMEHAARGLAEAALASRRGSGPLVVVSGPGNNGGDGYGCARFLASWGLPCRVVRCAAPPGSGDAGIEHALCAREMPIEAADEAAGLTALERALEGASVVVDALFGTGLTRALSTHFVRAIEVVNAARAPRVAADVPSGLDADSGAPLPIAVRADVTAAMGFAKRGCVAPSPGAVWAGRIVEIDIGLPASIHRRFLLP